MGSAPGWVLPWDGLCSSLVAASQPGASWARACSESSSSAFHPEPPPPTPPHAPPSATSRPPRQVADGYRPPLLPGLPQSVTEVIERCWKGDPSLRPTARGVVDLLQKVRDSGEGEQPGHYLAGGRARAEEAPALGWLPAFVHGQCSEGSRYEGMQPGLLGLGCKEAHTQEALVAPAAAARGGPGVWRAKLPAFVSLQLLMQCPCCW